MIENPGRAGWAALSKQVAAGLAPIFADATTSLGPLGQKLSTKALAKLSLSSERSVADAMTVVALCDRSGRDDLVSAAATVLRQVPFTRNVDIYEPIRQVSALALRSAVLNGGDTAAFELMLTFAENAGEPAAPRLDGPLRSRLEGLLVKGNARADHTIGSRPAHVFNICIDVGEFGVMWALGGSAQWPRERIDTELTACSAALRDLQAIV